MNETLSRNSEFVDQAKLTLYSFVDNAETKVYGNGVNGTYSTAPITEYPRYTAWGNNVQGQVRDTGKSM